jgi:APA family basic amino acid/polyamine antiporter
LGVRRREDRVMCSNGAHRRQLCLPSHAHVVAVAAVVALTAMNYTGVQKAAWLTRIIVGVVLMVLAAVVVASLTSTAADLTRRDIGGDATVPGVLQAASLLFSPLLAYARIATLGEEVRDPAMTIARAIPLALALTLVVYATVAVAALIVLGPTGLATAIDPLAQAVTTVGVGWLAPVVRVGAAVAALGSQDGNQDDSGRQGRRPAKAQSVARFDWVRPGWSWVWK